MPKPTDSQIVEGLINDHIKWEEYCYKFFRKPAKQFAVKFKNRTADYENVFDMSYTDAIIALARNVRAFKFKGSASLKTYFISIFKRKFQSIGERLKLSETANYMDEMEFRLYQDTQITIDLKSKFSGIIEMIKHNNLICYEILSLSFNNFTIEAIANRLNKKYNTVKTQKSNCIKLAQQLIKSIC